MPASQPGVTVEVAGLTKHFGAVVAVDDLSFAVAPGRVTGFLGPNGAGKTTTLRILLGLVRPTSGTATIDGHRYAELRDPLPTVGAALEATSFHPGRSGRDHLRVVATEGGLPTARVDELIDTMGMTSFARQRTGGYSTGMRQRLALAEALLGDPRLLVLDEPANGLDPEGIRWLRSFLRHLSVDQGKTVLVSSHLLQEVQQTVDDVVIIARGKLVKQGTVQDLDRERGVLVRSSDGAALAAALQGAGLATEPAEDGLLLVRTPDLRLVGQTAFAAGLAVWELRPHAASLEDEFLALTGGDQQTNQLTEAR